jgi:hypothetical protein
MNKRFINTGLIAFFLLISSCNDCIRGEGEPITLSLELETITSIVLNSNYDLQIAQGNEQKVEIIAPANIISSLNTNVKNGKWEIMFDPCVKVRGVQIKLTVPFLKSIRIAGSGNVKSLNNLNFDELALSIAGSGDMDLTVNSRQLASSIIGTGNITLNGSSLNHQIHIQGSGDVDAKNFETVNTKIEIIGSGDAEIFVTGKIDANISGSGDIHYKDTGVNIVSVINGSGEIVRK